MGANLLSLLSLSIFTHAMGATIFGYYVLFLTFIGIIDSLFNFKTWQAFIKFATDFHVINEDHRVVMLLKYSVIVDAISLLFAFVVAYISTDYFITFFSIPVEYSSFVSIMTVTLLFNIVGIATGIFRFFDEFIIQSKIAVYVAMFKVVLFALIALMEPSFSNFIYATVLSGFMTFILTLYYANAVLRQHGITFYDIFVEPIEYSLIKKLKIFSFIVYNNFDVAVRMVSRQLDIVILGKLYSAEIVGIYRIAKEIANIIAKLTDPVYQAIYPELAKLLAKGHFDEAKKIAFKIALYAGFFGIIFYLFFAILGEFAIGLSFGKEFLPAYAITLVYFIAIFIAIVALPIVPLLQSRGLVREAFWNQFFATGAYLLVIYPLTEQLSAIGASIAYIIFYLCWLFLSLITLRKHQVFKPEATRS